jgi:hypothetical protein
MHSFMATQQRSASTPPGLPLPGVLTCRVVSVLPALCLVSTSSACVRLNLFLSQPEICVLVRDYPSLARGRGHVCGHAAEAAAFINESD